MKRLSIIAVFAMAGCGPAFEAEETKEAPAEVIILERGEWVAPPPCDITARPPKAQRLAPERRR